ncbi:MAG: phosphoribosylformylglycinamidine synthase I, partial [Phycisphaerae bacterium]
HRLIADPTMLADFPLIGFPGGFSYGDDIAAGRIFAQQIVHHLHDAVRDFVHAGKPVIGICNGFQVLLQTGLLPGGASEAGCCTLTYNVGGSFVSRWVEMRCDSDKCVWTRSLQNGGRIRMPMAHGEGRFLTRDAATLATLNANHQVVLRYVAPDVSPDMPANPNGSEEDVAGICDETGLVFGLMPHPERFLFPENDPAWTRRDDRPDHGDGLQIFQNAVAYVGGGVGAR